MNKLKVKIIAGTCIVAIGLLTLIYFSTFKWSSPVFNPLRLSGGYDVDHLTDSYCLIVGKEGELVTKIARMVFKGDEIITGEGKHFRVVGSQKDKATAEYLGQDKEFLAWQSFFETAHIPAQSKKIGVAIYHSHSDESYVPTDGTESQPFRGGILEVGDALSSSLRRNNINVLHDKTPHEPHDANAYIRSRRTATRLLKQGPVALMDIHRDGVPDADFYKKNVSGQDVTQLRLVVGRQNPRMEANLDFAKRLMAYSNKIHPGLIKEIFIGTGDYNQDLMPTALLVEVGTHVNDRPRAEKGVSLLADSIPVVLGLADGVSRQEQGKNMSLLSSGGFKVTLTIIILIILGVGGFLVISTGGVKQAWEQLKGFSGKEFNGLGRKKNK